jgi:hypothetical protein
MTIYKPDKLSTTFVSLREFQNVRCIFNPEQAMNVWGARLLELDPPEKSNDFT